MDIKILDNILSKEDISRLAESIDLDISSRPILRKDYPDKDTDANDVVAYLSGTGRIDVRYPKVPHDIIEKISKVVKDAFADDPDVDPEFSFLIYAEYSKKSGGDPQLRPHADISENKNILILDYQLESNTSWDIGVEYEMFSLKDNSALLFNPATKIHYRPKKKFNNDESIKMLFFRFVNNRYKKIDISKILRRRDPRILELYNNYYSNIESEIKNEL